MKNRTFWVEWILPSVALFVVALVVRVVLECGFVMGDDMAVVAIADTQSGGIRWIREQVNLRFGVWAPYLLTFKLFGTGELAFFVPTWVLSSSFANVAYVLLRRWGYSLGGALFGGLFVGLSPFEVLIGASLANDIIFSAVFVYAFLVWQYRDAFPKLAGALIGALLWFGFFNKAWVVYLLPFLGLEFLRDWYNRGRRFGFWACLVVATIVLHAATAWSYMRTLHDPFPLLKLLPAHYPTPRAQLRQLLLTYPNQILTGDPETQTTLFGVVPYVWLVALCLAIVLRGPRRFLRDRPNLELLVMWLGIFALINFVPNYYSLTEYHSAPRIFRYLSPISFFLSLHCAKLLLDCAARLPTRVAAVLAVGLLIANVVGAVRATGPGRENRRLVHAVTETVAAECPPEVLIDNWQGYFFGRFYLREKCPKTVVRGIAYRWLGDEEGEKSFHEYEAQAKDGTMMVTGLGSYVYYPCNVCRIEPAFMKTPIAKEWEVFREIGRITFKREPIDVRVWRWRAG